MKILHQVLATAVPADAVTDQALAWRHVFRRWGLRSEIVAEHVHQELKGLVHRLDGSGQEILAEGPLVVRYSIWGRAVEAALEAPGPHVLWYHNVTPGDLLRSFNPGIAALCDQARQALTRLRGQFATLVADSRFNALDLEAAGLGDVSVVPLLLDVARPTDRRDDGVGDPIVLSVGRIAPNKRIEDVVKVFTLYQRYREPSAALVLVGPDDGFEDYRLAVGRLAARVGAERVRFTGRVPPTDRDRWYAQASAYICMSVHEGFCAPLVEALACRVPVVARNAGAVPETLGGAGLVLDGDELPLFAEALHEVVSSPSTRAGLAIAAARRLVDLHPETVEERGRAALRPVLAS